MNEIDTYLQSTTAENRKVLQHIRDLVHKQIPDLEECISYGMPGFRYIPKGKVVLGFAINKNSMSVYPHSGSTIDKMKSDVSGYRSALSALQFTVADPLPDAILKEMIDVRFQEILEGYGTKK